MAQEKSATKAATTLAGVLITICLLEVPSVTEASHKAPARYQMDMSQNDALCRPILNFYNKHLNNRDDEEFGYLEDRFEVDGDKKFPSFYRDITQSWQQEDFHSIDIYNNGHPVNVFLRDVGINNQFMTFGTVVIIMTDLQPFSASLRPKAPSVAAWISFPNGNLTENANYYPLLKYPEYNKIKASWDSMNLAARAKNIKLAPPKLSYDAVGQRLIRFRGRTYVIARERSDGVLQKTIGFRILVYQLHPPGQLDDVCYMQLRNN